MKTTQQNASEELDEFIKRRKLLPSEVSPPDEIPFSTRLEILVNASQVCNLQCRYCFVDQGRFAYDKQRVEKLSPAHAKRLVQVLPEGFPTIKEFNIHFYGGEPLLNLPAIEAAVDAAEKMKNSQFSFTITTNGTITTDAAITLLKRGHFSIVLSIDGPEYIHDAVRRTQNSQPTHAIVMDFLKKVRADPPLYVRGSSVVRKGWRLRDAEQYLNTLDINLIKAQAVRIPRNHPLALSQKELEVYTSDLREVANAVISVLKKGFAPRDDRFNTRVLQVLRRMRRFSFCGAGKWNWGMAADGTIFPCVLLAGQKDMILGHIDDPISEWVKKGELWFKSHGLRDECRTCWASPFCAGGCPVMLQQCQDECSITRANCECALAIYGAFYPKHLDKLLHLANIPPEVLNQ